MKISCKICNKEFYPHDLYLIDGHNICENCREKLIVEANITSTYDEDILSELINNKLSKSKQTAHEDGLKKCERCGRPFSILYPLKSFKGWVNMDNTVDMEERGKTYYLCEDCYDDFISWVRNFLDYRISPEMWTAIFKHDKEIRERQKQMAEDLGIKE